MATKKTKANNVIPMNNEEHSLDELKKRLEMMIAKRNEDIDRMRKRAMARMDVLSKSYLTANGAVRALNAMRSVRGDDKLRGGDIKDACDLACYMSERIEKLSRYFASEDIQCIGDVCDDQFEKEFCTNPEHTEVGFAKEVLVLEMCSTIGEIAKDIQQKYELMAGEIEKTKADIKEAEGK